MWVVFARGQEKATKGHGLGLKGYLGKGTPFTQSILADQAPASRDHLSTPEMTQESNRLHA